MIRSALVKFARSERARTRCFVETCQRGVFANSVVISPPPPPPPASGGGNRPSLRIALTPLHLNTPPYPPASGAHSLAPLSRLRGPDREGAGTKLGRAGRPPP